MFLEIVTPEASVVTAEINSVTVPGKEGSFQVLKNHASLVSLLVEGAVVFNGAPTISEGFEDRFTKNKDGDWSFDIHGGTVELKNDKIIILAD